MVDTLHKPIHKPRDYNAAHTLPEGDTRCPSCNGFCRARKSVLVDGGRRRIQYRYCKDCKKSRPKISISRTEE